LVVHVNNPSTNAVEVSVWSPKLVAERPLYLAIVHALEADIAAGVIVEGTRLPPQRDLAERLNVSVGTITKAYSEAERRGILAGEIGRGTYVRRTQASPRKVGKIINLALNVAPPTGEGEFIAAAMGAVAARGQIGDLLDYSSHQGRREHREIVCAWLSRSGFALEPANVVVTLGAQHGILIALSLVAMPGDTILTECFTYSGIAALAAYNRYRLYGVEMDAGGLLPEALDRAFSTTRARVLYTMPTFQTPTNAILSPERREAIATVLRRHNAYLIEDDVYGFLHPGPLKPLSMEVPEQAFYITSFAKSVAPGLRVGAAVIPIAYRDGIANALRATSWMAAPITADILSHLIQTGDLARLVSLKRSEAARRSELAARILPLNTPHDRFPSFHVWLPVEDQGALAGLVSKVGLHGVSIAPPTYVAPERGTPSGIRLCLGAPASMKELESALKVVADALENEDPLATL
jgi:DNA-binding transcriptional MocR family regulator